MNSMAQSPQRQAPGRASAVLVFLVVLAGTLFGVWREHELARSGQAVMKAPAGGASAPQWIVLMGGTALSFLLYSLFSTQAQLRQEAEFSREKILARDEEITALNRDFEEKITARTTELREANERSARFRAVIESTTDLVAMASFEGRTLYLNQAGRRMMEFPDDLMVSGHEMSKFYPEDVNRFFSEVAIPQAMRNGFWAGETRLLTWNQREVPVSFVGVVIKAADGTPLHLACIARDISGRKEEEQELQRALAEEKELNRLKSNFISMVTHEIRTPLALILGSSEILSRYLDRLPPEKRSEHLSTIDSAVQRMSALMEDVLLFSKAEAGRMEFNPVIMDLKNFCAQLVDEIASTTNRRCPVQFSIGEISQPARSDENLLRHVFANLLANAAKYSPPGTPVHFSVSQVNGDALFVVRDGGMGIPADDRKRLFTPFHRGKNVAAMPGTGLGLVIVKHCVERHGGEIEIESAENRGTTVSVRLPLFSPAHTDFVNRLSQETKE
jgi:PAS domain S-box-containing protein